MLTQAEKGAAFRALHERAGAFVIPNPYDTGTARLLAGLGFEALATTSAGFAFTLGRVDYSVTRDEMMEHVGVIASATGLPVSADLENCYADDPKEAAEAVLLAAQAGAVGASIEDITGDAADPVFPIEVAAERVRAAAEAARSLPFPFTLTARAENYLWERRDLADTVARLQAFQEAGADVLYAPGLMEIDEIATVVRSVDRPVNALMGIKGFRHGVQELSEIGVKRVSVGSALSRVALSAFLDAARELHAHGTLKALARASSIGDLRVLFGG